MAKTQSQLEDKKPPAPDTGKKILEEHIQEWQKAYDQDNARAEKQFDLPDPEPKSKLEFEFEKLADEAAQKSIPKPPDDWSPMNGIKSFDEGLAAARADGDALVKDAMADGSAPPQTIREQIRDHKNVEFMRIQVLRGQAACHSLEVVTKKGTSILRPEISKAMEIAEIVRGREICTYGKQFTDDERAMKLCKLISDFGLKKVGLNKLMDLLEGEDKSVASYIKKKLLDGACGKAVDYVNGPN